MKLVVGQFELRIYILSPSAYSTRSANDTILDGELENNIMFIYQLVLCLVFHYPQLFTEFTCIEIMVNSGIIILLL